MPEKGKYLYGIVAMPTACLSGRQAAPTAASMGNIGIDGSEVYCIPYKSIAAVIHDCEAKAYSSDDKEIVKKWIVSHQAVVDKAWEQYGVIAPVAFDTIIKGEAENLKGWLAENYDSFVTELIRFARKAEYGVQIFWDVKKISEEIIQQDKELSELQKQIQTVSTGISYLYKKKMEQILKSRLNEKAFKFFKSAYDTIKGMVDDLVVENLKPVSDGRQMLMNISCLVSKNKEKRLGELLDEINEAGYETRFTGPWPPYSFVGKARSIEAEK